jgi:predicted hydrocarbon binding protein
MKQNRIADENKTKCVCPMVNKEKGVRSSILCYCSEGFAEKMFSTVVGHPVKAKVISSIHRGNNRCKYQI